MKTTVNLPKCFALATLVVGTLMVVQPPVLFPTAEVEVKRSKRDLSEVITEDKEAYPHYWAGVAVTLACSLSIGLGHIMVAKCRDVPSIVLNMYVGLFSGVIALFCPLTSLTNRILTDPAAITSSDWAVLTVLNLVMLAAMQLVFLGNKWSNPTLVSMLRCLEIVLVLATDMAVFKVVPGLVSALGTAAVTASVLSIPLLDMLAKRSKVNPGQRPGKMKKVDPEPAEKR